MSICSPDIEGNICYSMDDLIYICKAYNKSNKDIIKYRNLSRNKLWSVLNKKLNKRCNHHKCWLDQKFIPHDFSTKTSKKFKPNMPKSWYKNITEWLSTIEIDNVLNQYSKKYKDYNYYGAVPSDCPKSINCSLSNIKLNNNNIIGIVFNLDEHHQSGSHWVTCIIDLSKNIIYYYDSNGKLPNKNIGSFIKSVYDRLGKIKNKKPTFRYNKKEHQKSNTEMWNVFNNV